MKEHLEELQEHMRETHAILYRTGTKWKKLPDRDLVDYAYVLKQYAELCDELRKEVTRSLELMSKLIAKRCVEAYVEDPERDLSIRGETCMAIPDVKVNPSLPKRGTPEFIELCEYFGLDHEAIDAGLFRPHWPSLCDFLTEKTVRSESFPPGIVKTESVTKVQFRKIQDK